MRGERQDNGSGVSGADICFRYYSYMYAMLSRIRFHTKVVQAAYTHR